MRKILFASLIIFNVSLFSNDSKIIQKINNVLPDGLKVISVQDSEINGIKIVDIGDLQPLYVSEDGNHFFFGDLYQVDRSEIENLTEVHKNFKRKDLLDKALTNDDFISFKSDNQKHEIVVFTDVDCGFCRKFHNQIASYLDEGIQVNYLAFPRSGTESETYKKMSIAWCSANKQEVLTGLKEDKSFEQIDCEDNPIKTHFELAKSIEIQGTPTIISQSGFTIPGYIEAKELIKYLK